MSSAAATLEVLRAAAEVLSGARRTGGAGHGDRPHGLGPAGGRRAAAAARRRLDGRHDRRRRDRGPGARRRAAPRCATASPQLVKAHLVRDLGMCCGGSMEVFVEYLDAQARLVSHRRGVTSPRRSRRSPAGVGFRVVVVDDREDMLAHPAFAADQRLLGDVDELDAVSPTSAPPTTW
jgi:hypothetical protein